MAVSSGTGEREPLLGRDSQPNIQAPKTPADEIGPKDISPTTRRLILLGIWSSTFLSSINMTLVPTMLPAISSDFNRAHQASWLGTAYLLATCTFTPLYGRLCNVLGRRGANQSAVFFAGVGTLLCGLSNSMEMLIFARFISGMGGGATFTTATIVVSDMYTLRSRGLAQGWQAVFNGLGMGLGGPFGGFITDRLGWRAAFLIQVPFFVVSATITQFALRYTTPGKGKSTKDVLKRIDYFGSLTLMLAVGGCLVFLSTKFNELHSWSSGDVIAPLVIAILSFISFVVLEIFVVPEPVLAPFLLKQRIPLLIGCSNFLVAMCNFSITYYFPMWFQTVMLTSASTAGLHLFPNSLSMSTGSMFAGWMMHRTGKYKTLNLIFGIFPFVATLLILAMRRDSGPIQSWLSIIPLGFGNAVVLQTTLIALLAHIPESHMAVGTGFSQLWRGVGQVGGVAISSAIFQSYLNSELHKRIQGPGSEELINTIRKSINTITHLPKETQEAARTSYDNSLKIVFTYAACSTFLAYCVRLPIPEKSLDSRPKGEETTTGNSEQPTVPAVPQQPVAITDPIETDSDTDSSEDESDVPTLGRAGGARPQPIPLHPRRRRFSMFESTESFMDFEGRRTGGSARPNQQGSSFAVLPKPATAPNLISRSI